MKVDHHFFTRTHATTQTLKLRKTAPDHNQTPHNCCSHHNYILHLATIPIKIVSKKIKNKSKVRAKPTKPRAEPPAIQKKPAGMLSNSHPTNRTLTDRSCEMSSFEQHRVDLQGLTGLRKCLGVLRMCAPPFRCSRLSLCGQAELPFVIQSDTDVAVVRFRGHAFLYRVQQNTSMNHWPVLASERTGSEAATTG